MKAQRNTIKIPLLLLRMYIVEIKFVYQRIEIQLEFSHGPNTIDTS